jgi:cobalt-zinc-cadmium efflux system membrane fusion protein
MMLITSNACGDVSPSANAVDGVGETSDQITEEGTSAVDSGDMKEAGDTVKAVRCNGRIEVPPQFKADIYARTPGYIETLHVLRGEKVKKGDLLATLSDQSILELQRSYLTSKLEVAQLAKVYERHQQLFKNQAVSEKELERSKTAYEQEQTNLKALTAELKFIGLPVPSTEAALSTVLEIRSPMDGFVNRVEANTGRRVQENQALFEVIDDSHKHIELDVFPNQAGRIALNQRVIIRPSGGEKEAEGYVYLINSAIDDVKQTVNVHVHLLEDRADLRVSSYVEARILTDQIIVDAPVNGH